MVKRRPDLVRTVAVPLVLGLHAVLLLCFHLASRGKPLVRPSETEPALILLPEITYFEPPPPQTQERSRPPRPASSARPRAADTEKPAPTAPSEPLSEPITEAPTQIPPVDWANEAHAAAEATLGEKDTYRALGPRERKRGLASITKPQFAWAEPRVQKAPGAIVIRLSDRCVIAVSAFIMPACVLDELPPPRGDLFDQMGDVELPEEPE